MIPRCFIGRRSAHVIPAVCRGLLLAFLTLGAGWSAWAAPADPDLLALYDFAEAEGAVVKDRSGHAQPLDLRIEDLKTVRRTAGRLEARAGAW